MQHPNQKPELRPSAAQLRACAVFLDFEGFRNASASPLSTDSSRKQVHARSIVFWGADTDSPPSRLTFGSNVMVSQVAVASNHCVAVSNAQKLVFSWGDDEFGQLGHGDFAAVVTQPKPIACLTGKQVIKVACSGDCVAFLSRNGILQACGRGKFCSLGHGDIANRSKPQLVQFFLSMAVADIACGPTHMAAITAGDSALWTWGCSTSGQLGLGTVDRTTFAEPQCVSLPPSVTPSQALCFLERSVLWPRLHGHIDDRAQIARLWWQCM
eukprot:m.418921 g.418921  ORF g.418921 m.418921 type:complete len:269 (+) comp20184_c0_seq67:2687-3493(+)